MKVLIESVAGFPRDYRLDAHASVVFESTSGEAGFRVSVHENRQGKITIFVDKTTGEHRGPRYDHTSLECDPE